MPPLDGVQARKCRGLARVVSRIPRSREDTVRRHDLSWRIDIASVELKIVQYIHEHDNMNIKRLQIVFHVKGFVFAAFSDILPLFVDSGVRPHRDQGETRASQEPQRVSRLWLRPRRLVLPHHELPRPRLDRTSRGLRKRGKVSSVRVRISFYTVNVLVTNLL